MNTTITNNQSDNNYLQRGNSIETSFQRNQKQGGSNSGNTGQGQSTNNINVIIRVRPLTNSYQQVNNQSIISTMSGFSTSPYVGKCIQEIKDKKTIVMPNGPKATDMFTFDYVGDEDCQQGDIFKVAARPIVDQCLLGYNGTIFAYGQTSSGKTHTILGDKKCYEVAAQVDESQMNVDQLNSNKSFSFTSSQANNNLIPNLEKTQAGILPRSFDYLFQQIQRIKNQFSQKSERNRRSARKSMAPSNQNLPTFHENCVKVEFDIKCQFIEIYNENVYDLLDTTIDQRLNIRQDNSQGIYIEGGTQEVVHNLQDVMKLVVKGNLNRSIASTQMNRESSRSHAVFITHIKTTEILENGNQNAKISRFYIVDLAGSERCKDTGAEGIRLKEASNINKSLSVLGNVINKLSENSKFAETKPKNHINYRDSKLTYLLQDSLGGNAKTVIICNVNPHMQALKETRNTLQFAQRAKMIQNQAVINEDTNCVNFWKNKCQELQRQITKNGNALSRGNTLSKNIDYSMNDCDQATICSRCQGKSQNDDEQKDYEKMSIDFMRTIKDLSLQLKEVKDQAQINSIDVKKSIDSALQYRTSVKLQTELANTRSNKMKVEFDKLTQIRKLQDPNNEIYNQELMTEIDGMQVLIETYQQEICELKRQLENNPLLALKSCQVIELEKRIKEQQDIINYLNGNNDNNELNIDKKINCILDDINRLIAKSEHLYNSKKIERMNQDQSVIDTEMIDVSKSFQPHNNNMLQMSQMLDLTALHQKRDQELANIKLQYEEQLETIRGQLKKEQENVRRLKSFLTQTNNNMTASQYTFGDDMLQTSQISSIFQINRGQTQLMESQRLLIQSQQYNQNNQLQVQQNLLSNASKQTHNPFTSSLQIPQTQSAYQLYSDQDIIQEQQNDDEVSQQLSHLNEQLQQQSVLDIAEFEKLVHDCQIEINQLRDENNNLIQKNQELHSMMDEKSLSLQELTSKYDDVASAKIAIETDKMQLQSKIVEIQAQLQELEQENQEMFQIKSDIERLENENSDLLNKIDNLEKDLQNANNCNDYFSKDVLPTLTKNINEITEQFKLLKLENKQLKELKSNDSEKDQLQNQITTLQQDLKQKQSDLQRMHEALEQSLQSIDEQKEYIQNLNQKYQEQNCEYNKIKREFDSLNCQIKEAQEIIDESQKSLIYSENRIARLEKENKIISSNYKLELEKFEQKLKDTNSRYVELENENKLLQKDIKYYQSENLQLSSKITDIQRENTDLRSKYVTYKNMAQQQMDKMQEAMESVSRYRQSMGQKTENTEQLVLKYRSENEQMKELMKKKEMEMASLLRKLQQLDEFRNKLIEKDKELKRVFDLEKELNNTTNELKIQKAKCQKIEAQYEEKEKELQKLQLKLTEFENEFLNQSKLNDQAKFQYLNKVRGQNNENVKSINILNQEMKNLKLESKSMIQQVVKFSHDVLHKMKLDNWGGKGVRGAFKANPETQFKEYLHELLDIIGQSFNNLELQLETPVTVSVINVPHLDPDSNSLSDESYDIYVQQQIQQKDQWYQQQQQLQQQYEQQQQQAQQNVMNNQQKKVVNNGQLDRSMEMKENDQQVSNRTQNFNQLSNQKQQPMNRFNQSQQNQGVYQISMPIQSNKQQMTNANTQQQQQQFNKPINYNQGQGHAANTTQLTGLSNRQAQLLQQQQQPNNNGNGMIGRSGFAVPAQQQSAQKQRNPQHMNNNLQRNVNNQQQQQQQYGRQQSNNRDPSNTRMDIC